MTPAQERKWAQDILNRIEENNPDVCTVFALTCLARIEDFIRNPKSHDKAFTRKIIDAFEDVIWMRECQQGKITKDELWERLKAKGKAEAEKKLNDRRKRIERQLHPRRRRIKRPSAKK